MSPDPTPDDSIAAWLSAPELDALVARVESRLAKPEPAGDLPVGRDPHCRFCRGTGELPSKPAPDWRGDPSEVEYEPCFCVEWESERRAVAAFEKHAGEVEP